MNLQSAKKLATLFIFLSIAVCILGLVINGNNEEALASYGIAAIVMLFLAMGVIVKWCRCPWCGQLLFRKMYTLTVCPACHRDLVTGKKKKGKGGR